MKHKHLVVGGTFDLLHKGHESFLKEAFSKAQRVTIGLTSDLMAAKKGNLFEYFKTRRASVVKFLTKKGYKNWQIVSIADPFGTAISDKSIDAILVSNETMAGAIVINKKREIRGLKPLEIVMFKTVLADDGKKISSGRIKNGEINRQGKSFLMQLARAEKFMLPVSLRLELAKPLGRLYGGVETFLKSKKKVQKLFVVGDASVASFLKQDLVPNLSIVDFKIQRKEIYKKTSDLGFKKRQKYQTVKNLPGEITSELTLAIHKSLKNNINLLKVDGEEDLAVMPLVLLAPLGAWVVYGQRDQGIVAIEVSEQTKNQFLKILELFITPISFNK